MGAIGVPRAAAAHPRTGAPLHPAYLPAQLAARAAADPAAYARAARWTSLAAFLYGRWLGRPGAVPVSESEASWSGLYDPARRAWCPELLRLLPAGLAAALPPVAADAAAAAAALVGLAPAYAARWPAFAAAPFFLAVGVGVGAALGSLPPAAPAAAWAVSVGTSAAVRAVLPRARMVPPPGAGGPGLALPDGLWLYAIDAERVLVGGALSDGGSLLHWLDGVLRPVPAAGEDAAAAADTTESASRHRPHPSLTILPFLAPERAPGWDPAVPFALLGATHATTAADLRLGAIDAVAARLATIGELLEIALPASSVATPVRLYASGSALNHSPQWQYSVAHALGKPLYRPPAHEQPTAAGVFELHWPAPETGLALAPEELLAEPNAAGVDAARAFRARQQRVYDALT